MLIFFSVFGGANINGTFTMPNISSFFEPLNMDELGDYQASWCQESPTFTHTEGKLHI